MELSQRASAPTAYRFYDIALRLIRTSGIDDFFNLYNPARGVIFTLHRVRPSSKQAFQPNLSLEITPEFLDKAILSVKSRGMTFVSLDEALVRLAKNDAGQFAVLTFDDGYRDVVEFALPVLEKHGVPATVYIVPGYVDRDCSLWWLTLEEAIRLSSTISFKAPEGSMKFVTATLNEKHKVFQKIHSWILNYPPELVADIMSDIAHQAQFEELETCRSHCLDWINIDRLSKHPLITIGAHSLTHALLAKCSPLQVRDEMVHSREQIEERINRPVRHFSYPNGSKENAGAREFLLTRMLGFRSATTVRPSLIYKDHIHYPTALPRVSLTGYFQSVKILETMMSGAPFLLRNFNKGIAVR